MTDRQVLPRRRAAESFDFDHQTPNGGFVALKVSLGFYDDGRIGEVFVSGTKVGTDLDIAYREAAILLSFALQHGADIRTIRSAMIRSATGNPEGVIGSLLDAILTEREAA